MAKESSLWNWLSKAKHALPDQVDLRRVEDAMGAGFPDVDGFVILNAKANGDLDTCAFKLELKSEVRPVRLSTPLRFKVQKRFAQLEFMRRRYAMGENAYFLLQVGEHSERRLYLAPGDCGARLKAGILESELAVLCATEGGYVFDSKAKQLDVIRGVAKCSQRR